MTIRHRSFYGEYRNVSYWGLHKVEACILGVTPLILSQSVRYLLCYLYRSFHFYRGSMPTPAQKNTAALIAMVLVLIPAVIVAWLSIAVLGDSPLGDRWPGNFTLAVAKSGGVGLTALKVLPMLVAFGLSYIIPKSGADWRFFLTVVASFLGLIACIYLFFS